MCCQEKVEYLVDWCTVWYNLMLRDVLLRYWPEWCHVVTVAVCKGGKKEDGLLAQAQTMLTRTFESETCLKDFSLILFCFIILSLFSLML